MDPGAPGAWCLMAKTVCCGTPVCVLLGGRVVDMGYLCLTCDGVSAAALNRDGVPVPQRPRDPPGQDGALRKDHRFAHRLKVVETSNGTCGQVCPEHGEPCPVCPGILEDRRSGTGADQADSLHHHRHHGLHLCLAPALEGGEPHTWEGGD